MIFVPIICVLFTISVCDATAFSCHFYANEIKSLNIFCEQNQQELPKSCVQEIPLNATDVIRLKIERCDESAIGDASMFYVWNDWSVFPYSSAKYNALIAKVSIIRRV